MPHRHLRTLSDGHAQPARICSLVALNGGDLQLASAEVVSRSIGEAFHQSVSIATVVVWDGETGGQLETVTLHCPAARGEHLPWAQFHCLSDPGGGGPATSGRP